jgi:nucleotide-binding universal stress UspA family protein
LIFLLSFALAHWTAYLARKRSQRPAPFHTRWFPAVPAVGGFACGGLALFQGVAVPAAGGITAVWLALGSVLYFALFASRAEAVDAFAQGRDPTLVRLRGRQPLILVPIANPQTAPALVAVANSLAPKDVGRVLLLTVMKGPEANAGASDAAPERPQFEALDKAQRVLHEALSASFTRGLGPEALLTTASDPWREIARVVQVHACQSLVLGLSDLDAVRGGQLENLLNRVECDVVVLRAPPGFRVEQARRVLVPVGGRGGHDEIRAGVLGSLGRGGPHEITFCSVVGSSASESAHQDRRRMLQRLAEDETPGVPSVDVLVSDDVVEAIVDRSRDADLVILGLQRHGGKKLFGEVTLRIARSTQAATLMISRGG